MRRIRALLLVVTGCCIDFADPYFPYNDRTETEVELGESDREMGASNLRSFPQAGSEDFNRLSTAALQLDYHLGQRNLARQNGNNIFSLVSQEEPGGTMNMKTRGQAGSRVMARSRMMRSNGKGRMMGSNGKGRMMGSNGSGGMNQQDPPGEGLPPGKGKGKGIDHGQGCWIDIGGSKWGGGSKSKKGSPKGSWWNWASHYGPHKVWDPYCRLPCFDSGSSKSKKGSKSGKGKGGKGKKGGSKSKSRPCPMFYPRPTKPMPSPPTPTTMMTPTRAPIQMMPMPTPTRPVPRPTRRPTLAPTPDRGTVPPSVAPTNSTGTRAPSQANGTTTAPVRPPTAAPV
jgi:hypothetical protein